ncbi:hypothetical protein QFZ40_001869 [Arthrobacter pascens]|nr:hypothetical protein [Arthrobacter pascens]
MLRRRHAVGTALLPVLGTMSTDPPGSGPDRLRQLKGPAIIRLAEPFRLKSDFWSVTGRLVEALSSGVGRQDREHEYRQGAQERHQDEQQQPSAEVAVVQPADRQR